MMYSDMYSDFTEPVSDFNGACNPEMRSSV